MTNYNLSGLITPYNGSNIEFRAENLINDYVIQINDKL